MTEKILITGVAGFIGSRLAARLLETGRYDVAGIDDLSAGREENIPNGVRFDHADIRDARAGALFRGMDAVFHLAARNCIPDCQNDPAETASVNIVGTVRVLEAARRAGVRKVIYADSSAVYEGSDVRPTPETEDRPQSFYAVSKSAAALFAAAFRRHHGLALTGLRYFCVYGPAQDFRRSVPPVMSAFILKLLQNERPVIFGTGRQRRDFIHVDDVNDFHLLCLSDPRTDHLTFNLGSGANHSVLEILDLSRGLLGRRIEPLFRPGRPGEAESTLADISRARALGWAPRTDLRAGLESAIRYIGAERAAGRI